MNPEQVQARLMALADSYRRSGPELFDPMAVCWDATPQVVVFTFLSEPDAAGYVRVLHEDQEKLMLVASHVLRAVQDVQDLKRPLKNAVCVVKIKYKRMYVEIDCIR